MRRLPVGARGSPLSRQQAPTAITALARRGVATVPDPLLSSGDREHDASIENLPGDAPFADDWAPGPIIGISSSRRRAQILRDVPRILNGEQHVGA